MQSAVVVLEQRVVSALKVLTLNRPAKLNALDLEMVRLVAGHFGKLCLERCCVALVMRGEGKAFCAGGDVAAVRVDGLEGGRLALDFFAEEYALNGMIGRFGSKDSRIKQISLWDGIVMGGGVGLSAHGRFRVATEKAVLAMPETQIGLFPDVGASYLLQKMPRYTGVYAGLTGDRLDAADLLYSGLATHFVPSARIPALMDSLESLPPNVDDPLAFDDDVHRAIEQVATSAPGKKSKLMRHADAIETAFSQPTVESILAKLREKQQAEATFEQDAIAMLNNMSPTSLKVTLESIRRARHDNDLFKTLKSDFRVASRMTDHSFSSPPPDFFEGIRALLVDKDKNPQWRHTSLQDVSPNDVDAFFQPFSDEKKALLKDLDFNSRE